MFSSVATSRGRPVRPSPSRKMQSHFKELCESVQLTFPVAAPCPGAPSGVELLLTVDRNTHGESYEVKTVLFNHAIKEKGWTFTASLEQVKKKLLAATNRKGLNATVQSVLPVQPRVAQTVEASQISTKRTRQINIRDRNPKQQKVGTALLLHVLLSQVLLQAADLLLLQRKLVVVMCWMRATRRISVSPWTNSAALKVRRERRWFQYLQCCTREKGWSCRCF